MFIWKQKKRIVERDRIVTKTTNDYSESFRYLFLSRYSYKSYLTRYLIRKIGSFVKWAVRHRNIKTLPSFNTILATMAQYSSVFMRLCSFVRFSYISRNLLHINLVFRLLQFYNKNAFRSVLFGRLAITKRISYNAKIEDEK